MWSLDIFLNLAKCWNQDQECAWPIFIERTLGGHNSSWIVSPDFSSRICRIIFPVFWLDSISVCASATLWNGRTVSIIGVSLGEAPSLNKGRASLANPSVTLFLYYKKEETLQKILFTIFKVFSFFFLTIKQNPFKVILLKTKHILFLCHHWLGRLFNVFHCFCLAANIKL